MAQATFYKRGNVIDYTPQSGDVLAGDVVVVGGIVGVASRPIPKGEKGAVAIEGVFIAVKDTSNISEGDPIYWNASGNPVDGTAGSGAMTTTAGTNTLAGHAVAAAGSTAPTVLVKLLGRPDSPHPEAES